MLSIFLIGSLSGCKPTDFFTEIVIDADATEVDENNEDRTPVNSPDAEEESSTMTALAWTDESPRSEDIENLVVYSSEPTTDLTTHHSIFDLKNMFNGIEASDGVRLVYNADADIDHTADATSQDVSNNNAQSMSAGSSEASESAPEAAGDQTASQTMQSETGSASNTQTDGGSQSGGNATGGSQDESDTSGGGTDGPQGGDSTETDNSGEGDNSDTDPDDGDTPDPYAGYNGTVQEYNPGDAFAEVQRADHLAVLGGDVAVMAQSLGGAGAVCATSDYAYRGLDSSGTRVTTYSTFSEVFANEISSVQVLWSGDGSNPTDLSSVDALVSACGKNGVIVYDQRLGNQATLFTDEQRRELYAAGIQLVPVDPSTVQGILDMAQVIGDALSESDECAQDAYAMSRSYQDTVNNIVSAVAKTNGGYLAGFQGDFHLLTKYNSLPVTNWRYSGLCGTIAVESESGLVSANQDIDASKIVLFSKNATWTETPLFFWMQTAGVMDQVTRSFVPYNGSGLAILWGTVDYGTRYTGDATVPPSNVLSGGSNNGALSRWMNSDVNYNHGTMGAYQADSTGWMAYYGYGLGSSLAPYVIVCASDGKSAGEIKSALVDSMTSASGTITPYSLAPYKDHYPTFENGLQSALGTTRGEREESPFYSGLSVSDVVRENPIGLLGEWTEGTMESVLEAVWLADIYSVSPSGCDYVPQTDMSKFSVSIGSTECTTARQAILAFYETFYRCDASAAYSNIVTDEGL